MKKWKCTVCGYIHTGDAPPEVCPLCGADSSKFIEVTEEETLTAEPASKDWTATVLKGRLATYAPYIEKINALMTRHHLHPISVHIPNGVIPIAFVFLVLAVLFDITGLARAAFYNMIFVLITMPIVLYSGYNDWKTRYGGNLTHLILTKIICGIVVTGVSLITVIWWLVNPQVAEGSYRFVFLFFNLVMLGAAGIAGFLGGKLVFKD